MQRFRPSRRAVLIGLVLAAVFGAVTAAGGARPPLCPPGGLEGPRFGGGDGKVVTDTHGGAYAAAIQHDGKIIVGGGNERLTVARYFPNGRLDRSFAGGIKTSGDYGVFDIAI